MARERGMTAALLMEFLGPFALVFFGEGTIVQTGGRDLVAIALAHGLAIGLLVAAGGHISGGVYNPALACGLMASGKLPVRRGLGFIVAQLLGALAAALVLKAILPGAAVAAVQLGTPAPGPALGWGAALITETIATFFLMFVVFGVAVDKRGPAPIAGLAIGLTITLGILMSATVSGGALNPARALAPALVQGDLANSWIYLVGPILGALLAALLYTVVMLDDQTDNTPIALP